jgi:hypothetical protein
MHISVVFADEEEAFGEEFGLFDLRFAGDLFLSDLFRRYHSRNELLSKAVIHGFEIGERFVLG